MGKKINEHIVKVLGLGNVENNEGLDLGEDVILEIEGNVLKVEDSDNQDGTTNRMYKVKIIALKICQPKQK